MMTLLGESPRTAMSSVSLLSPSTSEHQHQFSCTLFFRGMLLMILLSLSTIAIKLNGTACSISVIPVSSHAMITTATDHTSNTNTTKTAALQQNHQNNSPSCPNYEYTKGQWKVVSGDVPTRTNSTSTSNKSTNDNNTDNLDYEWTISDPSQCLLEAWDRDKFCRILNGRNILMVGDSVSQNFYNAFLHMYQQKHTVQQTNRVKAHGDWSVHLTAQICSGQSIITFIRNDHISVSVQTQLNATVHAIRTPWVPFLQFHEITILNTGAHTVEFDRYEQTLYQVKEYLDEYYTNGTVIFRTTPRGHYGCKGNSTTGTTSAPIGTAGTGTGSTNRIGRSLGSPQKPIEQYNDTVYQQFFPLVPKDDAQYKWWNFPHYNTMMKNIITQSSPPDQYQTKTKKMQQQSLHQQQLPRYAILDIAPILELRPDIHVPKDCLHLMESNRALKVYYQLLYNILMNNIH